MAIDVRSGQDKKYIFIEQDVAAFGVAEADTVVGIELDIEHFSTANDFKTREFPGAHGARWDKIEDTQTDVKGSLPTFTLAGPARDSIDNMFYGILQNVTEGAISPFDKTFSWHATQPDFSSNAGFYATMIEYFPIASRSWKCHSAVCKALTLTCEPGGTLDYSAEWQAMGGVTHVSNPTGTYTREQANIWHFEDIDRATIDFGAGAQNITLMGFEVGLTQEVLPLSPDGSGSYATWALTQKKGTFKIKMLKDVQTQTALTNITSDTKITVNLGWGNATPGTDDGDMDITFVGKALDVVVANDDISMTEISGVLAADDATSPIDIVMANLLDRTW